MDLSSAGKLLLFSLLQEEKRIFSKDVETKQLTDSCERKTAIAVCNRSSIIDSVE